MADAQWLRSREIAERIYIQGTLTLETPAQFGGTGSEGTTDMPLLYDPRSGNLPLLAGASIAGALRAYLREVEIGFEWSEDPKQKSKSHGQKLFGHLDDSQDDQRASVASWLAVEDAIGTLLPDRPVEFRDGVSLDPETRTAEDQKKYDMELLPAGTLFPLSFELWLTGDAPDRQKRRRALATALGGLERGEIALGRHKRRGLGQCRANQWQIARYDMTTSDGLIGWLRHGDGSFGEISATIAPLLEVEPLPDQRARAIIEATFALEGSLLIRSYAGDRNEPDMVHLRSWREGSEQATLPGTSLAGAIRARALRIARTVHGERGDRLVDDIFGTRGQKSPTGSRLVVRESVIENGVTDQVQSRVKIDRFTGGSFPQALFDQVPVWGKGAREPTTLALSFELRRSYNQAEREDARVGLVLLVLKDLWTGDLPLGGESSVGRGRLRGQSASIRVGDTQWELKQEDGRVTTNDPGALDHYVQAFVTWQGE